MHYFAKTPILPPSRIVVPYSHPYIRVARLIHLSTETNVLLVLLIELFPHDSPETTASSMVLEESRKVIMKQVASVPSMPTVFIKSNFV